MIGNDDRYNEFQSISQGPEDVPVAGTKLRDLAKPMLAHLQRNRPAGERITLAHLMNRATAGAYAGCHETAGNKPIATGRNFPAPVGHPFGFVHIEEDSRASPALTDHVLPFRRQILLDALCAPSAAFPMRRAPGATPVSGTTRNLLKDLRGETSVERRLLIGAEIERNVARQRATEQAAPGAFVRNRRPH